MKKRTFLAITALLISAVGYSYDFKSGGLFYNFISEEQGSVSVTNGDELYKGSRIINYEKK